MAPLSTRERAPLDAAAAQPDFTQSGGASDADLERQIEALRAFLARYPSADKADTRTTEPAPATQFTPAIESTPLPEKATSSAAAMPAIAPPDAWPALETPVDAAPGDVLPPPPSLEAPAPQVLDAELPVDDLGPEGLFSSHVEEATSARAGLLGTSRPKFVLAVAVSAAVLLFVGFSLKRSTLGGTTGVLSVDTDPVGVPVLVDGASRGVTPLEIDLPVGEHLIELVSGGVRRAIPVTIRPGALVSHFLELAPAASELGELVIRTDVPGVPVLVDGRPIGRSPVTVRDLAPGAHAVVLLHEAGSVTERVVIESGRTTSLVASTPQPRNATAAGWIAISAPTDVQIYENGQLLGSSRIERIMLPVGRHQLELVNEALGYRQSQVVHVTAGEVSRVSPRWPQGSLALNAIPWAEVWIDGAMVGETPIGSLAVPIGVHEIVFRHPELGERRATVTVTMGAPAKVGIDLGTKEP